MPDKWLVHALSDPQSIEFYGALSLMKTGIVHSDRVTTVSENYAREILTPRFGHLMEGVLQSYKDKLSGIVNGIDVATWNPACKPMIERTYSFDDMRGKHACKRTLQRMFGLLVDPFVPLIAIGSRMTGQKLADVVLEALPCLFERHPRLQLAVIGKGEAYIEKGFRKLAQQWPDRVGVHIGYDERRTTCCARRCICATAPPAGPSRKCPMRRRERRDRGDHARTRCLHAPTGLARAATQCDVVRFRMERSRREDGRTVRRCQWDASEPHGIALATRRRAAAADRVADRRAGHHERLTQP